MELIIDMLPVYGFHSYVLYEYFIVLYLIPILISFVVKSLVILSYMKITDSDSGILKKMPDIFLISSATSFFLINISLFNIWFLNNVYICIVGIIIMEILIVIIEAKYYSFVWYIPFKKCLQFAFLANALLFAVFLILISIPSIGNKLRSIWFYDDSVESLKQFNPLITINEGD